jgi:lysophospholipase L1-like esterase
MSPSPNCRMKTWKSRSLVGILALQLIVAGHVLAQTPRATEHWVATWATSQTLVGSLSAARGAPPARGGPQLGPPGGTAGPTAATTAPAAPALPSTPTAQPPQPGVPARRFPVPPQLSGVSNQTVRMIVRTSLGGSKLRVRLSNAFAAATVTVGAARIARTTTGSAIDPRTTRALTFSGKTTATLYAGQVLVSDAIDLAVPALSDLTVSLYFPGDTGTPTAHRFALRSTYISGPGDFTNAADITAPVATMESYYWLAGVDVVAPTTAAAVVTFGDSITDGDQSTLNRNASWPSVLAARLQANRATSHLAVINAGISGNRILGDNGSGLARMVHDVFSQPGVKWITLLEGINDITNGVRQQATGTPFAVEDLVTAYRQVIAQAHLRGIRVIGCTLTPFGGSSAFSETGESIRSAANHWIRTSGEFDAVIDFDRATRDPANPLRFRREADSPDLLHPGDAGYRLMGESIDLGIFTTTTSRPARD